jgi:GT2 family glycosyltransferase
LDAPYAVLLNNDIELAENAVDPLIDALVDDADCFMTAPLCWQSDSGGYEGFRTAIQWRLGLVRATAQFPGCEASIDRAGLTASAGAALAVEVAKFNALGGFDARYLPGRIEDLDFAIRGYLAGWHARYVPRSIAYHRGMATFLDVYGPDGCDRLALRNTLLWQWKNLRHPWHVARQVATYPLRIAIDVLQWPLQTPQRRWRFTRALLSAWRRWREFQAEQDTRIHVAHARLASNPTPNSSVRLRREREFFRQFHPEAMRQAGQLSGAERPR